MNFFDSLISDVNDILAPLQKQEYPLSDLWQDIGKNELILHRDCAFELEGVGFNLVSDKPLNGDKIIVVGKDLGEIAADTKFARISFIQTDDVGDDQKAYNLIRKIEYAKYHYFPKGYMIRTSSGTHIENIRVSKSALSQGLNFQKAGSVLAEKYKENDAVKAVQIVYITDRSVGFKQLEKLAAKNYDITETLNHIMQNIKFDCAACNLKPICDEVEGMRELHFKHSGMK